MDLSTFEFVTASHEITRIRRSDRVVEFSFRNIFLPDSIHNEPESHGFIRYKIQREENLPEGTRIENTAHIIFDFNPAIVTNTTLNTMVSVIGISSTDDNIYEDTFKVFPNPASTYLTLLRRDGQPYEESWSIYDLTGLLLQRGETPSIDVSNLESGTYLIRFGTLFTKFQVFK